jgi:hypothetical protein
MTMTHCSSTSGSSSGSESREVPRYAQRSLYMVGSEYWIGSIRLFDSGMIIQHILAPPPPPAGDFLEGVQQETHSNSPAINEEVVEVVAVCSSATSPASASPMTATIEVMISSPSPAPTVLQHINRYPTSTYLLSLCFEAIEYSPCYAVSPSLFNEFKQEPRKRQHKDCTERGTAVISDAFVAKSTT